MSSNDEGKIEFTTTSTASVPHRCPTCRTPMVKTDYRLVSPYFCWCWVCPNCGEIEPIPG